MSTTPTPTPVAAPAGSEDPRSIAMQTTNPCHTCLNLIPDRRYCRHLKHAFENGYAMRSHAATCGAYTPVPDGEAVCSRCSGAKVYNGEACSMCNGKGSITDESKIRKGIFDWIRSLKGSPR